MPFAQSEMCDRLRSCALPRGRTVQWEPRREQADLSAQQPPAREDARLSAAHADASWSRDPGGAAPQGPRTTLGLAGVLPAAARMRRREDFTTAVRRGSRAGRTSLVLHVHRGEQPVPARFGFVVPRGVGPAVTRNRVRRRLRHLLRARLTSFPSGSLVVVRVLPGAAEMCSRDLAIELDVLTDRLAARGQRVPQSVAAR